MRVLLIAPLPPPITGHSIASQTLADGLAGVHDISVVNLSEGSLHDGRVTVRRILAVARAAWAVWRTKRRTDAIYFTISESRAGNLKDLLIYLLCADRLRRMTIHLHGGTIGRELFERHPLLRRINARFIERLSGVIVSGPSHEGIFAGMIDPRRLHAIPNSADPALFVDEGAVVEKFHTPGPLRFLYLSSMTPEKGYLDLLDGWLSLAPALREGMLLDFAGRFETEDARSSFEGRIASVPGVRYHGLVDPQTKRRLFAEAHAFCLPTRMSEGQPISILEAYASGCAVLTTGQPGIRDVFAHEVNGFEMVAGSVASITAALGAAREDPVRVGRMAINNRHTADERYRATTFTGAVARVIEGGAPAGRAGDI